MEPETKIATLSGVREYSEGYPVEVWLREDGRVVVRAFNECGNNRTDIDLLDLLAWSKTEDWNEFFKGRSTHASLPSPI